MVATNPEPELIAKPPRRRRRWPYVLLAVLILFVGATIRLFMVPARDAPRHVDAIVVLGGHGAREALGAKLAKEGYAPNLLYSRGDPGCPAPIAGVRVECFKPDPFTTQGEARYAARLARERGWKSMIVVMSTDQTTRARLRFKRCTSIDIAYVTTPTSGWGWPYRIAYEWAALAKALVVERSC